MNRNPYKSLILVILFIFLSIVACKLPAQSGDEAPPGTIQAMETEIARLQSDSPEAQDVEQEAEFRSRH